MLSYQHSFHAGNFADVLKHIVLVEVLEHLAKKDKPFEYIDTHAGAGIYHLDSEKAQKLAEHNQGIAKLHGPINEKTWPELGKYLEAIKKCNPTKQLTHYPGSPLIASHYLRAHDRSWLYELHPNDSRLLKQSISRNKQAARKTKVTNGDGLAGLLSLLPPTTRRGLVLIDPSYEVKSDYRAVFSTVQKAYKKFTNGTYAIWYPVVNRDAINRLEKQFIASGIRDIQRFELGLTPDTDGHGMTSSGMIVINPPWGLFDKMRTLLPKLAKHLAGTTGDGEQAIIKCDVLVTE
ncbi:MAG: 23S rRNA (adenine2030-N6)-methyltransferase [Candidatus Endobugula sp.]